MCVLPKTRRVVAFGEAEDDEDSDLEEGFTFTLGDVDTEWEEFEGVLSPRDHASVGVAIGNDGTEEVVVAGGLLGARKVF